MVYVCVNTEVHASVCQSKTLGPNLRVQHHSVGYEYKTDLEVFIYFINV